MAHIVLTDAKIWWDGFDLSADHNQIALDYGADALDETAFGDTTHIRLGGLKTVQFNGNGWYSADTDLIDPTLFGKVGNIGNALAVSPDGGDEGEVGYFFRPMLGAYNIGAEVGAILPFNAVAEAQEALIRGTVMQNGTETTSTQATERQLGAVSATQKLYAVIHVLSKSGTNPTLDVLVRSAASTGMGGATTRITFAQATDRTSAWATPVSGAITDTWWDITWTIGGTNTPTFNFIVLVGIL